MSAKEKIGWLGSALFFAVWLLTAHTLIALMPGGTNPDVGRVVIAHITMWLAGIYLFVLLLRGVYLAGRSS